MKLFKWFCILTVVAVLLTAGILGFAFYYSTSSIHELLTENRRLSEAVHNLTREEQIGYAVLESQTRDESGAVTSEIRFVQTAPDDPDTVISERIFTVNSDVVHFDALIVKFSDEYVKDGRERALYLWRRIYGEETPPSQGQPIEAPGSVPERYDSITRSLRVVDRKPFWGTIWDLANNPSRLSNYGITAIFGNAVYVRPKPGKVYLFKINRAGQIYPKVVNAY